MRALGKEEKEKRGCLYCLDCRVKTNRVCCKHNECPYHELDEYETYEDFFNSQGGLLENLFELEEI